MNIIRLTQVAMLAQPIINLIDSAFCGFYFCLNNLKEQVRSGDASATELFELGAVMLRRKFYPAANKFLLQAIQKWDGDDQDLAQVIQYLHTHTVSSK